MTKKTFKLILLTLLILTLIPASILIYNETIYFTGWGEHAATPNNKAPVHFYVISLDRQPERFAAFKAQADKYGINVEKVSATDGYKIIFRDQETNDVFTGQEIKDKTKAFIKNHRYDVYCDPKSYENKEQPDFDFAVIQHTQRSRYYTTRPTTPGEVGVSCSHRKVWKRVENAPQEQIAVIFEDDVVLLDNFNQNLDKFIHALPKSWDIAYLNMGLLPFVEPTLRKTRDVNDLRWWLHFPDLVVNDYFIKIHPHNDSSGGYGYVINKESAPKLLSAQRFFLSSPTTDVSIAMAIHNHMLIAYVAKNKLVTVNASAPSEIGKMGRNEFDWEWQQKNKNKQYLIDADFDRAMTHGDTIILDNMSPKMAEEFHYYKKIYEAKKPSKMPSSSSPIIPKIMHQIWNDNDLPPLYDHYFQECKALHPDWEFKIWTNDDVAAFNMQYKHLYDSARSWQAKADIFRYEMLHRYGGVYRDLDVKCIRPLDELLYKYDFFAGLEAYNIPYLASMTKRDNYNGPYMVVNNGVIGSAPQNKIFSDALESIEKNFYSQWDKFDNGTLGIGEVTPNYMTVSSTMYPLSTAFKQNVTINDKAIVLPTNYIFPRMWRAFNRPEGFLNNIKNFYHDVATLNDSSYLDIYLPQESLVNHNEEKQDTILPKWSDKRIQKYYNGFKLSRLNNHRLAMVQNVSIDQDKLSFSKVSLIPEKLIFIVLDESELDILKENLPKWKLFNAAIEIDIWDKKRLATELTDIFEKAQKHTDHTEALRFLLGIELLYKNGGNYADFRAKPLQPIFELGNKYQFYGSIAPLDNTNPTVEMSTKLIGSVPSSPILSLSLEKFYDSKFPITESLLDIATKNNMIYGQISKGKIMILPAMAFHPIKYKHGKWSKLWNILTSKVRDFYGTTIYSVLE